MIITFFDFTHEIFGLNRRKAYSFRNLWQSRIKSFITCILRKNNPIVVFYVTVIFFCNISNITADTKINTITNETSSSNIKNKHINLPDTINMALRQNLTLIQSALNVQSALISTKTAESDFDTTIIPEGSAGTEDKGSTLTAGLKASKKLAWGTRIDLSSSVSKTEDDDDNTYPYYGSVKLEINQPLFRNFGTLIHREHVLRADSRLKEISRILEILKADIVVNIVQTYVDLLRLNRLIASDKQSLHRMNMLYKLTQMRERQGHATRVDTLRVNLQKGQAESRLENHQETYIFKTKDLAELLGLNPETTFTLDPLPLIKEEIPAIKEAVKIALKNRLDYAQSIQVYKDSMRGTLIAKRNLLPSIKLITRFEQFGEGEDSSNIANLDNSTWFIGLSTDTEFFKKREHLAFQQAVIDEESAKQQIEIVALAISKQVQQELSAYRRIKAELLIANRNLKMTKSRLNLAQRLFKIGRGDNFSVTDAENSHLEAEDELFTAQAECSASSFRLRRSLGTLIDSPENLKPETLQGKD